MSIEETIKIPLMDSPLSLKQFVDISDKLLEYAQGPSLHASIREGVVFYAHIIFSMLDNKDHSKLIWDMLEPEHEIPVIDGK